MRNAQNILIGELAKSKALVESFSSVLNNYTLKRKTLKNIDELIDEINDSDIYQLEELIKVYREYKKRN
jgi:predicted CopG family antitoxin